MIAGTTRVIGSNFFNCSFDSHRTVLMSTPEDNEQKTASAETAVPATRRPMIEAIGLSKFYGPFAAAREVSFSVSEGELVAFLGPNGAGKSTTMKMLTGYIAASEGEARIAGHNMMEDRIAGSRRLGYLPENGPLYPEMTPMSMLDFFAEARGIPTSKKRDHIDRAIDICDLSSVIYKPISKLSKGFKQRVGMSQALLHDPDVLILDEPTAGLDPNQIRGVRDTMRRLAETKTILLSTHILQEVEAMTNRVILINLGNIVFDGTVDEIRKDQETLDAAFNRYTTV